MSDPKGELGLSCPNEGQFYICDTASIRFIGCCTVDPCTDGSGECPQASLRTSSFSSDHYNEVRPQTCVAPHNETTWYTCQAGPFLGCCESNPCQQGECPQSDLLAARLSDNARNAQVFLSSETTTASSSSSTSTPTSGATGTPSSNSLSSSLSLGAIVGISIGSAVVIFILLGILAYKSGCWARKKKLQQEFQESSKVSGPGSISPYDPHSPAFGTAAQWQDQHDRSTAGSHPNSPTSRLAPYSPNYFDPSSTSTYHQDAQLGGGGWHYDPRHASHMTGTTWNSVATSVAQKHHSGGGAMELEAMDTERPKVVSELPANDQLV
ncbi:uncharacterized protein BCR38DRAFT_516680 [Pseudomassariella vexata]|uniref:Mid2 domain-containing protein n=1 Tax=Pseudomassariella vexata TaxID=1141098 RepID=A0A1Y2DWA3_9PEZI|nr:uncharacterized protein BCR38DRAFT_516680 [Pseudomassariella vexata]ORY63384.1 hypothetical protein BCR38DRAFT_516680 [Pseudomassariella vexata]